MESAAVGGGSVRPKVWRWERAREFPETARRLVWVPKFQLNFCLLQEAFLGHQVQR